MMEKLFVFSSEGNFHLKVENEAVPISEIIENRRLELSNDSGNITSDAFERTIN